MLFQIFSYIVWFAEIFSCLSLSSTKKHARITQKQDQGDLILFKRYQIVLSIHSLFFCNSLLLETCRNRHNTLFSTAPKVLVTTGYPKNSGTRKTEVIDVENSNVICKDLEDFPVDLYAASGANLTSMPIICGGLSSHPSDKCFKVSSCLYRTIVTIKFALSE